MTTTGPDARGLDGGNRAPCVVSESGKEVNQGVLVISVVGSSWTKLDKLDVPSCNSCIIEGII